MTLVLGFIAAFLVAVLPGEKAIAVLRKLGARQTVSANAPTAHLAKQGTPTMGGLLILFSVLVCGIGAILTQNGPDNHAGQIGALLVMTLGFGACGFLDDYLSAKRGKNLGLRAREKMAFQLLLTIGFCFYLARTAQTSFTTAISIPIPGAERVIELGPFYYVFITWLIVGFSNATNFTDGLDGLASGVTMLIAIALSIAIGVFAPSVSLYCILLAGALCGFLWWNAHPAKVFMGDTGSLALGGGLACAAAIGKKEVILLVASLVCWAELISVILQVGVFKYRKRTKGLEFAKANRLFRRTPLHHHFEELGWKEMQVVLRFWIAGGIFAALAIGLSIRG